jgi:hypothetical protein
MSRALLVAIENLVAEFPHIPLADIYVQVGEARAVAARQLPNVLAYQRALEDEAREQLQAFDHAGRAPDAPPFHSR